MIRSVVGLIYGAKVSILRTGDKNTLAICEREILRKIFGPVKENGVWMIRTIQE